MVKNGLLARALCAVHLLMLRGAPVVSGLRPLLLLAASLQLAACGGSIGGSSSESDPVIVDIPVAYIERPLPVDEDGQRIPYDYREPAAFHPGANLWLKDRSGIGANARSLTDALFDEPYDVKDLEVSYDGSKLVFAMRAPELPNVDDDEQPTWNIWVYDLSTGGAPYRVISSDISAEAGQDVAPYFLPDERIVFSSTRQKTSRAVLLDEGKPQFAALDENRDNPAFVLHVMDADGSNIQQLTFNQSHDLDPTVLDDGRIVFSRWDNSQGGPDAISLYSVNQDGSDISLLYGGSSHATGSDGGEVHFLQARELASGEILVRLTPFESLTLGGNFARVDAARYIDANASLDPAELVPSGEQPGQSLLFNDVRTDDEISRGGRYSAVYPMGDGSGRMLVSWSECALLLLSAEDAANRLADQPLTTSYSPQLCSAENLALANVVEADPAYALWVYNPAENSRIRIVEAQPGQVISDVVDVRNAAVPAFGDTTATDPLLAQNGYGVLNIRSVYDTDGVSTAFPDIRTLADPAQTSPDLRPVRFLRVIKSVSRPDDDLVDFGNIPFNRNAPMREILGYAPIEPDGSVKVAVPANVSFTISVLDGSGRRISARHDNWLQLVPGEEKACNGCHDSASDAPHGRSDGELESVYPGSLTSGIPHPNTVNTYIAEIGETMAETYWRVEAESNDIDRIPKLIPELAYMEKWVNNTSYDFSIDYSDYIQPNDPDLPIPAPVSPACLLEWQPVCRIVINYEQHVMPLWSKDRAGGSCSGCHSIRDDMGDPQIPAGQLELDENSRRASYQDLLQNDEQLTIEDGAIVVYQEPATTPPLYETDPVTGEVITVFNPDTGMDEPVVRMVTVTVRAPMSANGALASSRFFSTFNSAGPSVDHRGMLTDGELKLLREWLDIGAQYYNNPFDVPVN